MGVGAWCVCVQSCLTLQPMDCSPPGSSVHGIVQAKILEWVAISFSITGFFFLLLLLFFMWTMFFKKCFIEFVTILHLYFGFLA